MSKRFWWFPFNKPLKIINEVWKMEMWIEIENGDVLIISLKHVTIEQMEELAKKYSFKKVQFVNYN